MEFNFDKDQLVAIYRDGGELSRKAIKGALGDDFSSQLPVTERVQTLDDAIKELGNEHPAVKAYNSVRYGYSLNEVPDIVAYAKLRVITAALNEGWEPQFTKGENRWYGWYDLISNEDYEAMSEEERKKCRVVGRANNNAHAYGGLVYSYANYVSSLSFTYLGSRLAFKSEELAEYAAKQFIDIYADFCFIPDQKD